MKSRKVKIIIFIYFMACLIYCIWLPNYIKITTPKPTFSEYLAIQGVTLGQLKSAMEEINKKKYGGTQLAQMEARRLLGNDLGNKVMYNHGELVVNFYGDIITLDKIKQDIISQTPIRSKHGMVYFNTGSIKDSEKLYGTQE